MSFLKSFGMAAASGAIYELVYSLGQYVNTQKAVLTHISNGEIVELSVGAVLGLVSYFGLSRGGSMGMMAAALALPASAFLLIDGVVNVIKRYMTTLPTNPAPVQYGQVAQARGVRQVAAVRQIAPAMGFSPITSSSN